MAGRPSEYLPEYCDLVVEFGQRGESLVQFAAHIGVDRTTLDNWRKAHPAFFGACSRALIAAQAWWERKCQENVGNREFNSRLAEFQMAARFRDDYAPQAARIELHHTGQVQVQSLPRAELERLAAQAVIDVDEVQTRAQIPQTSTLEPEKPPV